MQIRPARIADAAALAALAVGHALFARYGLDADAIAGSLVAAQEAGDGVLVGTEGHRPLGFAWWAPRGAFARSPYLRLLVVAPGATGRGLGGALLDAVEARSVTAASDLFLLVTHDNEAALRFYARRGYGEVGRLPDYVVPGITEVIMRKGLTRRAR
jgi:ribosomal protein S18 acetylase RimI-like enzyme